MICVKSRPEDALLGLQVCAVLHTSLTLNTGS